MSVPLEDRLSIHELLARYNWAIDGRDSDGPATWSELFAPDGWFAVCVDANVGVLPGGGDWTEAIEGFAANPVVRISGRDELRRYAREALRARPRPGFHSVSNVVLSGDSERARSKCYMRSALGYIDPHPETVVGNGFYIDQLQKLEGEWRFASRCLYVGPASAARARP